MISKIEMDNLIKSGKKLIFKSTFIEIQKTEQHFKYLNRIFFNPSLNKEPYERVFIIEIEKPIEKKNLKEIIFILKNKWSKNNSKAIPDNDRFAPYIFFNGIDDYSLAQLKSDLQKENYIIKDGYEFLNASFNLQSLKERPTFLNRIFFKFINNQSDLELFLERIDRTTEIYQFFINNPISINYSGKHTKMEIKNIEEIKGII
ncbi:MAG: hypothetical protein IPQ05_17635 [Leptospiraceae bacterium]|nr:hypothetical protein [Leptospiraceae bacterium]